MTPREIDAAVRGAAIYLLVGYDVEAAERSPRARRQQAATLDHAIARSVAQLSDLRRELAPRGHAGSADTPIDVQLAWAAQAGAAVALAQALQ